MIHYFALVGFCIHKGKNVDVEGMHIKAIALYLVCYVPGVTLNILCHLFRNELIIFDFRVFFGFNAYGITEKYTISCVISALGIWCGDDGVIQKSDLVIIEESVKHCFFYHLNFAGCVVFDAQDSLESIIHGIADFTDNV